jgi:hypothetical protein
MKGTSNSKYSIKQASNIQVSSNSNARRDSIAARTLPAERVQTTRTTETAGVISNSSGIRKVACSCRDTKK